MFEAAELGRSISKHDYKEQEPILREKLLLTQFELQQANVPVYILLEGVNNKDKGDVINLLNQWFDTRGLEVNGFGAKTEAEASRPRFWRYWRNFPARGRIGLFFGSWYSGELIKRAIKKQKKAAFDTHMQRILALETTLARDGALILKFWLHSSQSTQKQRLKELKAAQKEGWKSSQADFQILTHYPRYIHAAERAIRLTDQAISPWYVIESEDNYYRDIAVVKHIIETAENHLATRPKADTKKSAQLQATKTFSEEDSKDATQKTHDEPITEPTILSQLQQPPSEEPNDNGKHLAKLQEKLTRLSWQAYHKGISFILVFEGWDAAGKGGAIRRIMQAVDARIARVISIAAPTDEEKAHHYLWRFWRHIPASGKHTIYDRSWYGRVLVERVEGFATENEWRRAYTEINNFEEQIIHHGSLLLKFWLHIDQEEQLKRFEARENIPYKQHKITAEDWRNRNHWQAYETAVNDMVVHTSTDYAPWTLIAANNKHYARIAVLEALCDQLESRLKETK
ncbi:Polyphosphate kinase 2 (PPK2) [Marinomonas spartinae]|uniref:Polyphosphate kinase 2 (PPK2) n=1 Tax=Marinomonas spartinae TaxID=1792290 RepID=A0A1A8T5T6_9GAMM|nr:polyphosphate:AMP phosphotransferase [Marinomonas spartinae]SBS27454.1 Polyphosphate kinase 2 (PPK2) [Marinomonas spartinae]SBS29818.1 Polyphosphate kinase 2 (PPK2) [Marinomonas spartinae]